MLDVEYKYKLTVVTVCFNASKDLCKTMNSVLLQNSNEFEYIIIDGGSKDNTIDYLKQNECLFGERLRWISEPDNGIYDAMNKGIKMAHGEWIIFMNAGDEFYRNDVISKLVSLEINDNIGVVYGDVILDFGEVGRIRKSFGKFKSKEVVTELCHQAVMTRTRILKKIEYDLTFKIMADLNSFKEIARMGYGFKYVPMVFAVFETTEGISATNPILSCREQCRLYDKAYFSFKGLQLLAKALYRALLLAILPKEKYNRIRYRRILHNKRFQ